MIAVVSMSMIMQPAGFIIDEMGGYYANHSRRQEKYLVIVPDLLCEQQSYACQKNQNRYNRVMMTPVTMPEGNNTDHKGEEDHEIFKPDIIYQIYPK